ncbi:MAG: hypothetical protein KY461_04510 [Actinobacteria bacterium]|nr:hypothetical protein [Actinomycetota bacterium]
MSRLDRLVRTIGPRMDEAEVLIASVLGHRGDGRGHVALVATDRRLLLVTEGFTRTMIDELFYTDVTGFTRTADGAGTTVEVIATEARWRVERIESDAAGHVALGLIERRCQRATEPQRTPMPPLPRRVRVLQPDVG